MKPRRKKGEGGISPLRPKESLAAAAAGVVVAGAAAAAAGIAAAVAAAAEEENEDDDPPGVVAEAAVIAIHIHEPPNHFVSTGLIPCYDLAAKE